MLVAASIAAIFLVLTGVCTDKDVSCGHWAADGQCVTNPEAMMPVCPLSCGVCKYECNPHATSLRWMGASRRMRNEPKIHASLVPDIVWLMPSGVCRQG